MDRYVKHIKRKLESDDERLRSNASKIKCQPTGTVSNWFYLSGGLVENAESTTADDGATTTGPFLVELCPWPRSPATPQKLPVSPMSTATKMESPEYLSKQLSRMSVARRLKFDDDVMDVDNCTSDGDSLQVKPFEIQQQPYRANGSGGIASVTQTTIATYSLKDNDRLRTIFETLSARGFIVKNHEQWTGFGDTSLSAVVPGSVSRAEKDDDDDVLSICGQFECLSVLEGVIYGVQAASKEDAVQARATGVLAAVGTHPNIVSYFSSWTDARFHYVQMELCPENLSSASDRFERVAEYRIVVEHVACALHYLHVAKKYVHNRVNRWNIYRTVMDGSNVYKLGGFSAATALQGSAAEDPAALADVRSLCTTVLRLMRYCNSDLDNKDMHALHSYLSFVVGSTTKVTVDALSVWRWCYEAREQQDIINHENIRPINIE